MSLRVLARPLAAATLSAALVLTAPLALADPGNGNGGGNGGGQESAPGQQEDKDKDAEETEKETGKASAPGQQKDKSKDSDKDSDKETGKDAAPGQQDTKEPQGPKPGKGPQGNNAGGNGNGGGNGGGTPGDQAEGDPAGNNGTVKIAPLGELDSIPNNTPHPGCTFQIEWYGFDEGADVVSTVSFAAHSPTSDVVIGGTSPSQVPVGGDPASGAGTETGLDGRQAYTLTFDGEPHPKQGYHVKLTVSTPHSLGNDTKTKVFWVAPCDEDAATEGVDGTTDTEDECTEDMVEGSTETECTTEDTTDTDTEAGVEGTQDQAVAGTQLAAIVTPVQNVAGLLTNADNASGTAAVPTSVDAGAEGEGPMAVLTGSPWPLLALVAGLLAGLGALVVRRRAGA